MSDQNPSAEAIFTAYGRALYLAQSMEIGMRIFYWLDIALPDAPPGKAPRVDFSADPLLEYNVYSLGGFIRQFRLELMEEGTIDPETRGIMRNLEQSVADRNYLVHSYWGARVDDLTRPEGRQEVLAELQSLTDSFRFHDRLIRNMVLLILKNFNLTPEAVDDPTFQDYMLMESLPDIAGGPDQP